ncbi:MAG: tetratricopeptide repeat protein [Candidatus Melainabacteria bacterium]|nr:tetratricopeptide repeat protein [Candidatus Melainabacteria bacterium]
MPVKKARSARRDLKLAISLAMVLQHVCPLPARAQDAQAILRDTFKKGGIEAASKGQYAEAEKLLDFALVEAEKNPREYTHQVEILKILTEVKLKQNKILATEQLLQHAYEVLEHYVSKDHPEVANVLYYLALLHIKQDQYSQAELELKQALTIYETADNPENLSTADSAYALGVSYYKTGQYQKAREMLKYALTIYDKIHGDEHQDFLDALVYLVRSEQITGQLDTARVLAQRALELTEKLKGKEHEDVAANLFMLGQIYKAEGQTQQAMSLLKQAVEIGNKTQPSVPPKKNSGKALATPRPESFLANIKDYLRPLPQSIDRVAIMKEYLAVTGHLGQSTEGQKMLEKSR